MTDPLDDTQPHALAPAGDPPSSPGGDPRSADPPSAAPPSGVAVPFGGTSVPGVIIQPPQQQQPQTQGR